MVPPLIGEVRSDGTAVWPRWLLLPKGSFYSDSGRPCPEYIRLAVANLNSSSVLPLMFSR